MIKINGIKWRVLGVSPFDSSLKKENGDYALGMCDNRVKTIYINNDLNDYYFKKVLAHELTHAAMFSYRIHLNYYQEEVIADIIATYGEEVIDKTNFIFYRFRK